MILYFSVIAFSTLLLYLGQAVPCPSVMPSRASSLIVLRRMFYLLAFAFPFAVSALRYRVGRDYLNYVDLFETIAAGRMSESVSKTEPGYRLFCKLLGYLSHDSTLFFAASSFLIIGLFLFISLEYSMLPAMSWFCFFALSHYFFAFNIIRQYIAMAICLFGYRYIRSEQPIRYGICILIAVSFHGTALIMLPMYVIFRLRLKLSYYSILFMICIGVMIFHQQLLNIVFRFAYGMYAGSNYLYYNLSETGIALSGVLSLGCICLYKPLLEKDKSNIVLINSSIFSLLIFTCFGWLGELMDRLALYPSVYYILTIPALISCIPIPRQRYFICICVIAVLCLYCFRILLVSTNAGSLLLPYHTIFSR